ncbi:uncharacterized protein LOC114741653 [Neltuma alba]|uniref:uncharacterized protein LOC114741653 n=1 Tax=Neltuma alba TaxID=207710 RepID=UPI0010A58BBC|nr:uncharacterized protein LOC114741653 [Prosopis alba]
MSLICWNYQGLGAPLTGKNLRFLCGKYKPSPVFLMETRVHVRKVDRCRRSLGFQNKVYVEPVGIGGGLALWWREGINLEVILVESNIIHVKVVSGLEPIHGFISFVYGPPTIQNRRTWWRRLRGLNPRDNVPWLCCGDFNDLLYSFEKEGGRTRPLRSFEEFQSFMSSCQLMDLDFKGMRFTWSNNRLEGANVKERLDRALCNGVWRNDCPNAQVQIVVVWALYCEMLRAKW